MTETTSPSAKVHRPQLPRTVVIGLFGIGCVATLIAVVAGPKLAGWNSKQTSSEEGQKS